MQGRKIGDILSLRKSFLSLFLVAFVAFAYYEVVTGDSPNPTNAATSETTLMGLEGKLLLLAVAIAWPLFTLYSVAVHQ
jgi:hypothetical protein